MKVKNYSDLLMFITDFFLISESNNSYSKETCQKLSNSLCFTSVSSIKLLQILFENIQSCFIKAVFIAKSSSFLLNGMEIFDNIQQILTLINAGGRTLGEL